jgi:hypothetical protein
MSHWHSNLNCLRAKLSRPSTLFRSTSCVLVRITVRAFPPNIKSSRQTQVPTSSRLRRTDYVLFRRRRRHKTKASAENEELTPPHYQYIHHYHSPSTGPIIVIVAGVQPSRAGLVMRNEYAIIFILAVSAIHSEALVASRSCISHNHVGRRPTTSQVVVDVPGAFINGVEQSIHRNVNEQNDHGRYRTELHSSTVINGNAAVSDELVNEFQPRTMKVSESFVFFARFVVQTILDNRIHQSSGWENRRRLRDRIFRKTKQELTTVTTTTSTSKQKRGFRESMCKLNESRKSLIRLVGYDSSLLVPAFGYLIMGAFMSSVIPYYYSSCISCVAAGEANRDKLLWALGGLGVSHVLEAVFTGLRGALFWIAGEFVLLLLHYPLIVSTNPC